MIQNLKSLHVSKYSKYYILHHLLLTENISIIAQIKPVRLGYFNKKKPQD